MDDPVDEKKRRRNERKAARKRQRYAEEPEFRAKSNAQSSASRCKHKDARNAQVRDRYATDPGFRGMRLAHNGKSRRQVALKKKYGISLEQYAAKLAGQGSVCVICLKPKEKPLCVDHDHKTRKLRSLLC